MRDWQWHWGQAGIWPAKQRFLVIAGLVMVLVGVSAGAFYFQSQDLSMLRRQEHAWQQQVAFNRAQLNKATSEEAFSNQWQEKWRNMETRFVSTANFPELLGALSKESEQAHVQVVSIKPLSKETRQGVVLLPVQLKVIGHFFNVIAFIKSLQAEPYVGWVSALQAEKSSSHIGALEVGFTVDWVEK